MNSYGVTETDSEELDLDYHLNNLFRNGFTILKSNFSDSDIKAISTMVEKTHVEYLDLYGEEYLISIDEHNTVRAPFLYDPIYLKVSFNEKVMEVVEHILKSNFILNQQNIIINPGGGDKYNQLFWHRDLPYQHFVTSRPIALNALYCVCDFTFDNGSTQVLPGSHKIEKFPGNKFLEENKMQFYVSSGDYLLIDSMLYHSGSINKTSDRRIGINNVYSTPIIRRQIDFNSSDFLYDISSIENRFKKYLGLQYTTCSSVSDYLTSREK
uniref:Phytanoyl-CoA dioxygenase n=1 Tax=Marinomonas sp. (strain MWYL1) TaxID=400668 RepID=A6VTI3_MARMS